MTPAIWHLRRGAFKSLDLRCFEVSPSWLHVAGDLPDVWNSLAVALRSAPLFCWNAPRRGCSAASRRQNATTDVEHVLRERDVTLIDSVDSAIDFRSIFNKSGCTGTVHATCYHLVHSR